MGCIHHNHFLFHETTGNSMSYRLMIILVSLVLPGLFSPALRAQDNGNGTADSSFHYEFTTVVDLPCTVVKNQNRTGTCWSFSSLSFFESEVERMGHGDFDLSEMFVVRNAYLEKADKYVRMHGTVNFAGGGAFNDPVEVLRVYGFVPDAVYPGLSYGEEKHNHGELDAVLKGYIDEVIKNPNGKLSTAWRGGLEGILDAYLGQGAKEFTWEGATYTPRSFADNVLKLKADDYMMLSSFTHHPFYSRFVMEVPDNWNWGQVSNVKLDELMAVIDNALEKGFTVAWAADVSEKGFNHKEGVAVVPEKDWADMEKGERDSVFIAPVKEKTITQELRQKAFDDYETTDDHGMHIVGMAKDQNGAVYYRVKNSWGTEKSRFKGYFYASAAYVRYKTLSILVHRDAVPAAVMSKLK